MAFTTIGQTCRTAHLTALAQHRRSSSTHSRRVVCKAVSSSRDAQNGNRRQALFGIASLPGLLVGFQAHAIQGSTGLNDCDPICNLPITKAGDDEYASMMAALAERKKKAAEAASKSDSQAPPEK